MKKKNQKIIFYKEISKALKEKKRILSGETKEKFSSAKYGSWFGVKTSLKKIFFSTSSNRIIFFSIIIVLFLLAFLTVNGPLYFLKFKYYISQIKTNNIQSIPANFLSPEKEKNNYLPSLNTVLPKGISKNEIKQTNLLYIPKINAKAPILEMPEKGKLPEESEVQKYLREGVVLYPYTARPGEIGNVVIFGHSSRYFWEEGKYKYIFTLLEKCNLGDKIYIFWKGKTFVYIIFEKKTIDPTNIEIMYSEDKSILTLVTCTPPFKRLAVKSYQEIPSPSLNILPNHPLLPNFSR